MRRKQLTTHKLHVSALSGRWLRDEVEREEEELVVGAVEEEDEEGGDWCFCVVQRQIPSLTLASVHQ